MTQLAKRHHSAITQLCLLLASFITTAVSFVIENGLPFSVVLLATTLRCYLTSKPAYIDTESASEFGIEMCLFRNEAVLIYEVFSSPTTKGHSSDKSQLVGGEKSLPQRVAATA